MKRVTKNTTIGELLQLDPDIANVLTGIGMHLHRMSVFPEERDDRAGSRCTRFGRRRSDRRYHRIFRSIKELQLHGKMP